MKRAERLSLLAARIFRRHDGFREDISVLRDVPKKGLKASVAVK